MQTREREHSSNHDFWSIPEDTEVTPRAKRPRDGTFAQYCCSKAERAETRRRIEQLNNEDRNEEAWDTLSYEFEEEDEMTYQMTFDSDSEDES